MFPLPQPCMPCAIESAGHLQPSVNVFVEMHRHSYWPERMARKISLCLPWRFLPDDLEINTLANHRLRHRRLHTHMYVHQIFIADTIWRSKLAVNKSSQIAHMPHNLS